jgi:hypothetical protein
MGRDVPLGHDRVAVLGENIARGPQAVSSVDRLPMLDDVWNALTR